MGLDRPVMRNGVTMMDDDRLAARRPGSVQWIFFGRNISVFDHFG